MSLLMRRSFIALKSIELFSSLKPFRLHKSYHKINFIHNFGHHLTPIQTMRIQNLSTKLPESDESVDELNDKVMDNNMRQTIMKDMEDMDVMEDLQDMEVKTIGVNVTNHNMDAIKEFWAKHDISVHGTDAPLPVLDIDGNEWPQSIRDALLSDGFTHPTPIQCQGWPIVLSGRDMVGIAQTGSGKTLCYVLPAFVKILRDGVQRGPKCLVLAPTRELAQQIQAVVRRYRFTSCVCLYGGASRGPQMQAIRDHNPQIIIATPGRMNDFVDSNAIDLKGVDYLVVDEADRMLDMGFEPQIKRIIDHIPRERQTVMWSATWPKEVKELAKDYMKDYIQINVGGTQLAANKNINQIVEICEEYEKKRKLFDILTEIKADSQQNKTLIFAKTKQSVDYLTHELHSNRWPAICIHGDKTQAVRDRVLNDFRKGKYPILVATDVAARGLDVDDIKYVINYDYPNSGEDYVHRIGRTGRRDKKGTAYTFITPSDGRLVNELIEILRDSNQTISPDLMQIADMSRSLGKRRRQFRTSEYESGGYGSGGYGSGGYGSGGYGSGGYGSGGSNYSRKTFHNSNYNRNQNYNKYEGQQRRRPTYQSNYGSKYDSNYETNDPSDGYDYEEDSGRGSGPNYKGY